jgi:hypothetical protein
VSGDWKISGDYEATGQHSNPEIGVEIHASLQEEIASTLVI